MSLADRLRTTRAALLDLVRPLDRAVLAWQPAGERPSILQVLASLPPAERHYRREALRLRHEDGAVLEPYREASAAVPDVAAAFEALEVERRITLVALAELKPADLERRGRHPVLGEVTLAWSLEEILRNERRAIRAIKAVLDELPLTRGR